jgi:membrane-associated phospholipid phosphatase
MFVLIVIFVLCVALCGAAGLAAHRNGRTLPSGGPAAWGRTAAARYGAAPAALVIFVGGSFATWLLTLPVGFLAKALEGPLDHPAFRFTQSRVHASNKFTALNEKLTVMGNNGEIQLICLFALVVLACAYGRRWWVPVVLTIAMFYVERYAQRSLAKVVDRGHPPTSGGTFPSGGVARLLGVYGLLIVLALMLAPQISHAFRVGIYTGLGAAAVIEAYSRWYLAKHWITDALGGLVFGYLLLVVGTATAAALTYSYGPTRRGAAPAREPGARRPGAGPLPTHASA